MCVGNRGRPKFSKKWYAALKVVGGCCDVWLLIGFVGILKGVGKCVALCGAVVLVVG